MRLLINNKTVK